MFIPLFILSILSCTAALRIPVVRRASSSVKFLAKQGIGTVNVGGDNDVSIGTDQDLLYLANITIAGVEFPVQLDTGSSDLWIEPAQPLTSGVTVTNLNFNLTYGVGWASGPISQAAVSFAGYEVPNQAFVNANQVNNPVTNFGAVGILGLGFTTLSSIDSEVMSADVTATWGRPFLLNAFALTPTTLNFISFVLQRAADPTSDVQGSFTIGEYDPSYTAIANTAQIPTWPVQSPTRWNILLDSYIVNGVTQTLTSVVKNVPSGKSVVLLDSGTSYTYASTAVVTSIFGNVPGAQFSSSINRWIVPCDQEVDISLIIGGRQFDLHPLDVVAPSVSDPTVCEGTFIPQDFTIGATEFDWLLGDSALRSVYSVYDYGDFDSSGQMGSPYVKLLSLVDPPVASAEFHSIRGGTSNGTFADAPDTNSTDTSSTAPNTTSPDIFSLLESKIDSVATSIPIMLGILALNSLVLFCLVGYGVFYLCKRAKSSRKSAKGTKGGVASSQDHVYESVPVGDIEEGKSDEMSIKKATMFSHSSPAPVSTGKKSIDDDLPTAALPSPDSVPSPTPTHINQRFPRHSEFEPRQRLYSTPYSLSASLTDTIVDGQEEPTQQREFRKSIGRQSMLLHTAGYDDPIEEADERAAASRKTSRQSFAEGPQPLPRAEPQDSGSSHGRELALGNLSHHSRESLAGTPVPPPLPLQAYHPGGSHSHSRRESRSSLAPPVSPLALQHDEEMRRLSRASGMMPPPSPTRAQLSVPFPARPGSVVSGHSPSASRDRLSVYPSSSETDLGVGQDVESRRGSKMSIVLPPLPPSPSGLRPLSLVASLNAERDWDGRPMSLSHRSVSPHSSHRNQPSESGPRPDEERRGSLLSPPGASPLRPSTSVPPSPTRSVMRSVPPSPTQAAHPPAASNASISSPSSTYSQMLPSASASAPNLPRQHDSPSGGQRFQLSNPPPRSSSASSHREQQQQQMVPPPPFAPAVGAEPWRTAELSLTPPTPPALRHSSYEGHQQPSSMMAAPLSPEARLSYIPPVAPEGAPPIPRRSIARDGPRYQLTDDGAGQGSQQPNEDAERGRGRSPY